MIFYFLQKFVKKLAVKFFVPLVPTPKRTDLRQRDYRKLP
jgi:hypothetical protein